VETRKVTESLCDENTPSGIAAIMLGDFTSCEKRLVTSPCLSVRPHETTLKPMDGFA